LDKELDDTLEKIQYLLVCLNYTTLMIAETVCSNQNSDMVFQMKNKLFDIMSKKEIQEKYK